MLKQIRVYGIVQGVGFRPTVSRHALACGIKGSVCNKGPYVEIFAQGTSKDLEQFQEAILNQPPQRATILKMDVKERTDREENFHDFSIVESEKVQGNIFVSPDIAICDHCKKELFDVTNRRYLHPFINCTCCGPRLTILDAMPYDRERTSMKEFPMCGDCETEYHDSRDRRFDAQPVCCNACGPQVYLLDEEERGKDAIKKARKILAEGKILAVKGIGGFHLCCDATNQKAVSLLRERKHRPAKPFAVMMKNLERVRQECVVLPEEEAILTGHQKPILLLEKHGETSICDAVAPDNPNVGVMLPYAPVQLLLFSYPDETEVPEILVMTSGNPSGAPICRTDEDAREELLPLCDAILSHNRRIRLRADDSVMSFFENKPYMIRRSRGYAPLPVMLEQGYQGQVVAVGSELKNSFCIGDQDLFYLSPYIGDMADVRTIKALKESIQRMETLLEVKPSLAVCDLHPGYHTTDQAKALELPLLQVQHHYAHIVSCMAENNQQQPVLGIALDGTGYRTDHTIWGGEILQADYDGFQRLACIDPFLHVGGDRASKEGYRIALSLIHSLYPDRQEAFDMIRQLNLATEQEAGVVFLMADKRMNTIVSTSTGRIFDGVSAILGIRRSSGFEGEAAIQLEYEAEKYERQINCKDYRLSETDQQLRKQLYELLPQWLEAVEQQEVWHIPVQKLVKWLIQEKCRGRDSSQLGYYFHEGLAVLLAEITEKIGRRQKIKTVALSGGVFQNLLLLKLCKCKLEEKNMKVLIHSLVPANDGGIALGQAVIGMQWLQKQKGE